MWEEGFPRNKYSIVRNENEKNNNYTSESLKGISCKIGFVSFDNTGKVILFRMNTAFHTVDYNDTEYIAHQAMPSNKYIDLTLGASGSSYTAPADGYVAFSKYATAANQNISITCNNFISFAWAHAGSINIFVWMPVKKGDVFNVGYSAAGTYSSNYFIFIYAQGAQ